MARTTQIVTGKRNGATPKREVSELGRILRKLAEKHAASGSKLLNRRELERELAERRGGVR
jgi:hypothetical protein